MKKIIFVAALIMGGSFYATAQSTQVKATVKGEQKTEKKGSAAKKAAVLKSTSANEAHGPLSIPMPKHEVDTSALPAVKNNQQKK